MNDLPTAWIHATIESIAKIVSGKTPKNVAQFKNNSGSLPWIKVSDMTLPGNEEYVSKSLISFNESECQKLGLPIIPAGSTIFPKNGGAIATGKKRKTAINCSIDLNNMAVVPIYINSDFLFYWFQTIDLSRLSDGSVVPQINKSDIASLNFPLPPLGEQGRIVEKLDELLGRSRRAREELQQIPKLIQRYKQAVLAAAFRGDLTADWREENSAVEPASDLVGRIKAERRLRWEAMEIAKWQARNKNLDGDKWKKKYKEPQVFQNSTMSEAPDTWCWVYWEEVGICQNGRPFPSSEYTTHGVKLLRPGNLHISGRLVWTHNNTKFLDRSWLDQYPDYLIRSNELVMNLTAQSLADEFLGRICLSDENEKCLLNQRIARLIPILILPKFCLWLFKSPLFRSYVDDLNTGSLIQHIFSSQIDQFIFPLPPLEEQKEIVRRVEERFKAIEAIERNYQQAIALLDRLDQATLAKAFRGQLVPQDPNDEPASVLLERIRAQRASQPPAHKRKTKTPSAIAPTQLSLDCP